MLRLPMTTEFNKRIPKQSFYENLTVSADVKKIFVEKIDSIIWANKLSPSTMNTSAGESVKEIEVLHIRLKSSALEDAALMLMDKGIPYHIVFLLQFEDDYQLCVAYKEISPSGVCSKIERYYKTSWVKEDELSLNLIGFNMDSLYENIIRQIAGDTIEKSNGSIKTDIEESQQKAKLQKEIARLEKQARSEKQPKKKFELVQKINKLKRKV